MPAPRKPLAPRKVPQQARSVATAEALLRATARLLEREGYDAVTTNRIAREAGVSVGSLYQYFPSKEALVIAVAEQHDEALSAALARHLAPPLGPRAPLPVVVRAVVEALLVVHQARPRLHAALAERPCQALLAGRRAARREARVFAPLLAFLAERSDAAAADPETAVFVITHAVEAVLQAHALRRPRPAEAASGRLVEALTALVVRFLDPGRAAIG